MLVSQRGRWRRQHDERVRDPARGAADRGTDAHRRRQVAGAKVEAEERDRGRVAGQRLIGRRVPLGKHVSKHMSTNMSKHRSKHMSKHMSEHVSEHMPKHMSKHRGWLEYLQATLV